MAVLVSGLRSVSSARLRCAQALWAIAWRPPGSEAWVEGGDLVPGGRVPGVGCGRDGRRRMAALISGRAAVPPPGLGFAAWGCCAPSLGVLTQICFGRGRGPREVTQGGGGGARVGACGASGRFVSSASLRTAAPRAFADVLCPDAPQPSLRAGRGGDCAGSQRAQPGEGLPPPVPTQTRGSFRTVIECARNCIKRRQHPQVPLQVDTTLTEIARNDVHLQTFRQVVDTDCRDTPPRMLCTL